MNKRPELGITYQNFGAWMSTAKKPAAFFGRGGRQACYCKVEMQATTNNDSEHFILKSFRLASDEKKASAFFAGGVKRVIAR